MMVGVWNWPRTSHIRRGSGNMRAVNSIQTAVGRITQAASSFKQKSSPSSNPTRSLWLAACSSCMGAQQYKAVFRGIVYTINLPHSCPAAYASWIPIRQSHMIVAVHASRTHARTHTHTRARAHTHTPISRVQIRRSFKESSNCCDSMTVHGAMQV